MCSCPLFQLKSGNGSTKDDNTTSSGPLDTSNSNLTRHEVSPEFELNTLISNLSDIISNDAVSRSAGATSNSSDPTSEADRTGLEIGNFDSVLDTDLRHDIPTTSKYADTDMREMIHGRKSGRPDFGPDFSTSTTNPSSSDQQENDKKLLYEFLKQNAPHFLDRIARVAADQPGDLVNQMEQILVDCQSPGEIPPVSPISSSPASPPDRHADPEDMGLDSPSSQPDETGPGSTPEIPVSPPLSTPDSPIAQGSSSGSDNFHPMEIPLSEERPLTSGLNFQQTRADGPGGVGNGTGDVDG